MHFISSFFLIITYLKYISYKLKFLFLDDLYAKLNLQENLLINNKSPMLIIDNDCNIEICNESYINAHSDLEMRKSIDHNLFEILNSNNFNLIIEKLNRSSDLNNELDSKIKTTAENLFKNLKSVNEEIKIKNNSLYDYLFKICFKDEITVNNFSLKILIELLGIEKQFNQIETRKESEKFPFKTQKLDFKKELNYTEIPLQVKESNLIESCYISENKQYNLHDKYQKEHETSEQLKGLIYLGNTTIKNSIEKEYSIYIRIVCKTKLGIYLEEISEINFKTKKEIIENCKSMYLSKISHELKNPVCNMLELVSTLEEREKINKNKIKIYNEQEIIENNSNKEDNNNYIVNHLKFIANFISQVLKDFTFYCSYSSLDQELIRRDHINSIKDNTLKCFSRNSSFKINGKNYTEPSMAMSKNPIILNKECFYIDQLNEQIELLKSKSIMDNKNKKISLKFSSEGLTPNKIEARPDIFKSLIFNILQHIYKNIVTGEIEIFTLFKKENNNLGKLIIKIKINGTMMSQFDNFHLNKVQSEPNDKEEFSNPNESDDNNYFFYDDHYLNLLVNKRDPSEINKIIDEFNYHFNYNMALIYSKNLGFKMVSNLKTGNNRSITLYYNISNDNDIFDEFLNINEIKMKFSKGYKKTDLNFNTEQIWLNYFEDKFIIEKSKIKRRNTISDPTILKFSNLRRLSLFQISLNEQISKASIITEKDDDLKNKTKDFLNPINFDYQNTVLNYLIENPRELFSENDGIKDEFNLNENIKFISVENSKRNKNNKSIRSSFFSQLSHPSFSKSRIPKWEVPNDKCSYQKIDKFLKKKSISSSSLQDLKLLEELDLDKSNLY